MRMARRRRLLVGRVEALVLTSMALPSGPAIWPARIGSLVEFTVSIGWGHMALST
jgi:hypothetical protein